MSLTLIRQILKFLTSYWQYIAGGAVILLLGASVWWIDKSACKRCYEQKEAEYEIATQKQKEQSREGLIKIDRGHARVISEISQAPDGCIGPAHSAAYEWMRNNFNYRQ